MSAVSLNNPSRGQKAHSARQEEELGLWTHHRRRQYSLGAFTSGCLDADLDGTVLTGHFLISRGLNLYINSVRLPPGELMKYEPLPSKIST